MSQIIDLSREEIDVLCFHSVRIEKYHRSDEAMGTMIEENSDVPPVWPVSTGQHACRIQTTRKDSVRHEVPFRTSYLPFGEHHT